MSPRPRPSTAIAAGTKPAPTSAQARARAARAGSPASCNPQFLLSTTLQVLEEIDNSCAFIPGAAFIADKPRRRTHAARSRPQPMICLRRWRLQLVALLLLARQASAASSQGERPEHVELSVLIDTNLISSERYISKLARKFNCRNYGKVLHDKITSSGQTSRLKEYRFVHQPRGSPKSGTPDVSNLPATNISYFSEAPNLDFSPSSQPYDDAFKRFIENGGADLSKNSHHGSRRRLHFPASVRKVTRVSAKSRVLRLDSLGPFDEIESTKRVGALRSSKSFDSEQSKTVDISPGIKGGLGKDLA